MKKINIKTAANILGLNTSTLRYWEKEGLINFSRQEENDYREFTSNDLLEIFDLQLCRDLEIPLKGLKDRKTWDLEDWDRVSDRQLEDIEEKLRKYRKLKKKLRDKKFKIKDIQSRLGHLEFVEKVDIPEKFLVEDNFNNIENVKAYKEKPELSGIFISAEDSNILNYGIFTSSCDGDFVWQDKEKKGYLYGILKIDRKSQSSSIANLRKLAEMSGYKTGEVIGKYIISAFDGQVYCDYYGVYLKVI